MSWLVFDRVFRLGLGLAVGVLIARHLGPADYGMLNLSLAYAGVFAALATAGLEALVIRRLVDQEEDVGALLGTSFCIRLCGSVLAIILACLSATLLGGNAELVLLVAISSGAFIAQAGYVMEWLSQARHTNRVSSLCQTVAAVLSAFFKLYLIRIDASLALFALATILECAFAAILMRLAYRSALPGTLWRFDWCLARALVREATPLILSGFAFFVYTRMDQIMLGILSDEEAVGQYAAALRISDAMIFLPYAMVSVWYPGWVKLYQDRTRKYREIVPRDLRFLLIVTVILSASVSVMSEQICSALFGRDYALSGEILSVSAWIAAFSIWAFASGRLIVIEGDPRMIVTRNIAGIIVNFIGNLVLIPQFGGVGAAYATIISYFAANVLFYATSKRLRPILIYLLEALNIVGRGMSLGSIKS